MDVLWHSTVITQAPSYSTHVLSPAARCVIMQAGQGDPLRKRNAFVLGVGRTPGLKLYQLSIAPLIISVIGRATRALHPPARTRAVHAPGAIAYIHALRTIPGPPTSDHLPAQVCSADRSFGASGSESQLPPCQVQAGLCLASFARCIAHG